MSPVAQDVDPRAILAQDHFVVITFGLTFRCPRPTRPYWVW